VRVLMLGPGLDVRGGVTSVERLIMSNLPPGVEATHIATMVDGSKVRKFWTFLAALVSFEKALTRGVDVVHIHFASAASSMRKELLARRALRAGKKLVMHAHGAEYRRYWQQMSVSQQRRTLSVLSRVSALIVLGEVWREFFVSIGIPSERIVVLPNPVSLPATVPDRHGRPRVEFVYLGIIDKRKGAFDLLEAIRGLPTGLRERCHFVVAGNGETATLRGRVAQCRLTGTIDVRDWIDAGERDRLLAGADAFVLPSRNEGMPMAMLEAMAWGLPVICTPVGSIPEVVIDGQNGLMVQPGDIAGIAAAIERIASSEPDRLRMGAAARRTVEPLSSERYVGRLLALYDILR
jgi:glycosyltransferase involved in cell wall biosynthesis